MREPRIRVLLADAGDKCESAIAWQMLHALKGYNLLFDFGALPRSSISNSSVRWNQGKTRLITTECTKYILLEYTKYILLEIRRNNIGKLRSVQSG